MVAYLSKLGYEPVKVRNENYWYLSPLRNEITASFKVSSSLNKWYDHGIGKGGKLIDFCLLYFNCSVAELLQKLDTDLSFHQPEIFTEKVAKTSPIKIIQDSKITSRSLLEYLQQRKINNTIAASYCRQIRFRNGDKTYYAIGFKNDSGGFELRNTFFKGSSAPKDITTINNHRSSIAVFEGFFDFLSFLTRFNSTDSTECDYMVLNSLAFFEKARPVLEQHDKVLLFLDQDSAGQNCSKNALATNDKYVNESGLYKGYKDLNEWLIAT